MALASQFAAFGTRCIPRETMNTPSYGSQRAGRPGLRKDPAPGATAFWAYRIGRTGGARRPAPPVPLSSAAPGWAGDLMLAGRRFEVDGPRSRFPPALPVARPPLWPHRARRPEGTAGCLAPRRPATAVRVP